MRPRVEKGEGRMAGEWALWDGARPRHARLVYNSQAAQQISVNKFLAKVAQSFYFCSCIAIPAEIAEPIVDLLNRGASLAGIATREGLTAKRSRPEMAPQGLKRLNPRPKMVW